MIIRATERYAYGWTDIRFWGPQGPIGLLIEPRRPVPRTVIGYEKTGDDITAAVPRAQPIEQDWDHLRHLLTVEERKL